MLKLSWMMAFLLVGTAWAQDAPKTTVKKRTRYRHNASRSGNPRLRASLGTQDPQDSQNPLPPTSSPIAVRTPKVPLVAKIPAGSKISRETRVVAMTFPILGKIDWEDTFLADRDGGKRPHLGQDLMAPKMRPLVAAFAGVVKPIRSPGHNWLTLKGDNGWTAMYMHINIDTPGTRDEKGTDEYAFAAGITAGKHVEEGQLIGYCGDSGNARNVGAHLHFELHGPDGLVYNAAPSLRAATVITEPLPVLLPTKVKPANGEVRLDGYVKSVDPTSNMVVMDLSATLDANGQAKANTFPKLVELHNQGSMDLGTMLKGAPIVAMVGENAVSGGDAHTLLAFNDAVRPVPPPLPHAGSSAERTMEDMGSASGALIGDAIVPVPKGVDSATLSYWPIILRYAPTYQLDPALVAAVIQRESSGNPREVSSSGAMGLMQLMPDNVREYHVSDPFDPEQNIRGGMAQLSDYIRMFNGDIPKGLLAYNAGPRHVKDGTLTPSPDGRDYAGKVLAVYYKLKGIVPPTAPPVAPANPAPTSNDSRNSGVPFSKAIDYMLDVVNTARARSASPSAVENGWLADAAAKSVATYAASKTPEDSDTVAKRLATAGGAFQGVVVVSFATDYYEDFQTLWPNPSRPNGRLIGLGHGEAGGRHYWVVIVADQQ